jgi:predicted NAD/FAD-dependent oxidoreductase
MPELAEIHQFASSINEWAWGSSITQVYREAGCSQGDDLVFASPLPPLPWLLHAEARGKELKINISVVGDLDASTCASGSVTFTHGLVGHWEALPNHSSHSSFPTACKLAFITDTNLAICYMDYMVC